MVQTPFFVNTAMICYNCPRFSEIRLKRGFRQIYLVGQETEALDIVFVSCDKCIKNGAHKPMSAWLPKYVDPQNYAHIIRALQSMRGCTPNIVQSIKFSLTTLTFKFFMRVYDIGEIFNISSVDTPNIKVFEHGHQISNNCGFFSTPQPYTVWDIRPFGGRELIGGPQSQQMNEQVSSLLCIRCLSELEKPPAYTPDRTTERAGC